MRVFVNQFARRHALKQIYHRLDFVMVSRNDKMHVLGENRAGPDCVVALAGELAEGVADDPRLLPGELHGWMLERLLRLLPFQLFLGSQLAARNGLRRATEPHQLPFTDEIRPGTTRVIGKPESIRAENDVITVNHEISSLTATRRRLLKTA